MSETSPGLSQVLSPLAESPILLDMQVTLLNSSLEGDEKSKAERRYVEELEKIYGSIDGIYAAYGRIIMVMCQPHGEDFVLQEHPIVKSWDEKANLARVAALGEDFGDACFQMQFLQKIPESQTQQEVVADSQNSEEESVVETDEGKEAKD